MARFPRYSVGEPVVSIGNRKLMADTTYHVLEYFVDRKGHEFIRLRETGKNVSFHISYFEPKPLFGEIVAQRIKTLIKLEQKAGDI